MTSATLKAGYMDIDLLSQDLAYRNSVWSVQDVPVDAQIQLSSCACYKLPTGTPSGDAVFILGNSIAEYDALECETGLPEGHSEYCLLENWDGMEYSNPSKCLVQMSGKKRTVLSVGDVISHFKKCMSAAWILECYGSYIFVVCNGSTIIPLPLYVNALSFENNISEVHIYVDSIVAPKFVTVAMFSDRESCFFYHDTTACREDADFFFQFSLQRGYLLDMKPEDHHVASRNTMSSISTGDSLAVHLDDNSDVSIADQIMSVVSDVDNTLLDLNRQCYKDNGLFYNKDSTITSLADEYAYKPDIKLDPADCVPIGYFSSNPLFGVASEAVFSAVERSGGVYEKSVPLATGYCVLVALTMLSERASSCITSNYAFKLATLLFKNETIDWNKNSNILSAIDLVDNCFTLEQLYYLCASGSDIGTDMLALFNSMDASSCLRDTYSLLASTFGSNIDIGTAKMLLSRDEFRIKAMKLHPMYPYAYHEATNQLAVLSGASTLSKRSDFDFFAKHSVQDTLMYGPFLTPLLLFASYPALGISNRLSGFTGSVWFDLLDMHTLSSRCEVCISKIAPECDNVYPNGLPGEPTERYQDKSYLDIWTLASNANEARLQQKQKALAEHIKSAYPYVALIFDNTANPCRNGIRVLQHLLLLNNMSDLGSSIPRTRTAFEWEKSFADKKAPTTGTNIAIHMLSLWQRCVLNDLNNLATQDSTLAKFLRFNNMRLEDSIFNPDTRAKFKDADICVSCYEDFSDRYVGIHTSNLYVFQNVSAIPTSYFPSGNPVSKAIKDNCDYDKKCFTVSKTRMSSTAVGTPVDALIPRIRLDFSDPLMGDLNNYTSCVTFIPAIWDYDVDSLFKVVDFGKVSPYVIARDNTGMTVLEFEFNYAYLRTADLPQRVQDAVSDEYISVGEFILLLTREGIDDTIYEHELNIEKRVLSVKLTGESDNLHGEYPVILAHCANTAPLDKAIFCARLKCYGSKERYIAHSKVYLDAHSVTALATSSLRSWISADGVRRWHPDPARQGEPCECLRASGSSNSDISISEPLMHDVTHERVLLTDTNIALSHPVAPIIDASFYISDTIMHLARFEKSNETGTSFTKKYATALKRFVSYFKKAFDTKNGASANARVLFACNRIQENITEYTLDELMRCISDTSDIVEDAKTRARELVSAGYMRSQVLTLLDEDTNAGAGSSFTGRDWSVLKRNAEKPDSVASQYLKEEAKAHGLVTLLPRMEHKEALDAFKKSIDEEKAKARGLDAFEKATTALEAENQGTPESVGSTETPAPEPTSETFPIQDELVDTLDDDYDSFSDDDSFFGGAFASLDDMSDYSLGMSEGTNTSQVDEAPAESIETGTETSTDMPDVANEVGQDEVSTAEAETEHPQSIEGIQKLFEQGTTSEDNTPREVAGYEYLFVPYDPDRTQETINSLRTCPIMIVKGAFTLLTLEDQEKQGMLIENQSGTVNIDDIVKFCVDNNACLYFNTEKLLCISHKGTEYRVSKVLSRRLTSIRRYIERSQFNARFFSPLVNYETLTWMGIFGK